MSKTRGSLLAFRLSAPGSRSTETGTGTAVIPVPGAAGTEIGPGSGLLPAESHPAARPGTTASARPQVDCPQCGQEILLNGVRVVIPPARPAAPSGDAPVANNYSLEGMSERQSYKEMVGDFERRILQSAMQQAGGTMKVAAQLLGLKYTTFVAKAHRLGLVTG